MKGIITLLFFVVSLSVSAQFGNWNQADRWDASWISVPGAADNAPGLYLFRKTLSLETKPESFKVYVSGDNRFKLYVNEQLVSIGPALGDIKHWNYETLDLAPYLNAGNNIIAAEVWNEGDLKPVSQFSLKTGFVIQGTNETTKKINTNDSWKCIQDKSYHPIRQSVRGYYAAGAGDSIIMENKVRGWETLTFNDAGWKVANAVYETGARGMGFAVSNGWTTIPSILPQREMTYQRLQSTRKTEGVDVPEEFPAKKAAFKIGANSTAKILLDQSFYTNAYPTLLFSEGKDSKITITYSEALYDENGAKNNRNEIEGKTISGRQDIILSDGTKEQNFTALNWRTYRYIELKIETKDSPLTIEDFYGTFTGYPFEMNATINSGNEELDKILEIGWRTARSCAVETYMDCPYYERLQYIGDARIQLLVSYFNSGDDRLAKNALNLMDNSRQQDGYTLSRYPDTQNQVIATYSMWYVCMLHDYLLYGNDPDFLKDKLLGSRQILNYFITYVDTDGSLKNLPGWNFTDWASDWRMGTATPAEDGSTALLDLQLLLALQAAIEVEKQEGSEDFVAMYSGLEKKMSETIMRKYWDASRKIFADTPDKTQYSQHTNSMAILAGLVNDDQAKEIANVMLTDTTMTQATIYFKYYLHLALNKAGFGDKYLDWLDIWRKNIELGLTTWGETSDVESTRSDCHAWGASPNIEAYRIILGIESDAPYFSKVRIAPNLGTIKEISGEMPHPQGKIKVSYKKKGKSMNAQITLPENISGVFIWEGKTYELHQGENDLKI